MGQVNTDSDLFLCHTQIMTSHPVRNSDCLMSCTLKFREHGSGDAGELPRSVTCDFEIKSCRGCQRSDLYPYRAIKRTSRNFGVFKALFFHKFCKQFKVMNICLFHAYFDRRQAQIYEKWAFTIGETSLWLTKLVAYENLSFYSTRQHTASLLHAAVFLDF